jgi:hypothetical protein
MRNVAAEFRRQLFFPEQARQLFLAASLAERNDFGLPLQKVLRRFGRAARAADGRQLFRGANHFTQAFLFGTRVAEEVGKPIARLAFVFGQAVEERGE